MAQSSNKKDGAKKNQTQQTSARKAPPKKQKNELWAQILPFIFLVSAILLVVCFITGGGENPGIIMGFIYDLITGVFSFSSYFIPVFFVIAAFAGFRDKENDIWGMRTIFAVVTVVLLAVLFELITPIYKFSIAEMFKRGTDIKGGGVLGGLLGELFLVCFKSAGSFVIVIAGLILSVLLTFGITPKYMYVYITGKHKAKRERLKAMAKQYDDYDDMPEDDDDTDKEGKKKQSFANSFRDPDKLRERLENQSRSTAVVPKGPDFNVDVEVENGIATDPDLPENDDGTFPTETPEEKQRRIDDARFEDVMRRSEETKSKEELAAEKAVFTDGGISVSSFSSSDETKAPEYDSPSDIIDRFADKYMKNEGVTDDSEGDENKPASLPVERKTVSSAVPAKQLQIAIPKPEYKFPPIDLLTEDKCKKIGNIRDEMHDNAEKLVRVLESFNVKTKLVGVSRGPTITRYELLPETGTRVRSIANLVDDIALNLATSGVRIEAPIPGMAAVGIEVPNKSPETVYLRSLIDTEQFRSAKSRIHCSLGKDVAGEPVFLDIKKMPHLLIAGATGMGKSVCINCLLVSLLYKATPDEVKLILIDPKKVEFSSYNGLPHLLVPIISDPKKAVGSLTWAVNEMERRYGLIESVGVRDIESFNDATKNDPEYEFMPQIVIVIDELADLMATSKDDVETSIARIAAKARAAGMHLIIGTQRPSVDVISGVIKANIPSRIACTVASLMDSRTIIDRSGAENLIGRGDMLYNPVGCAKPIRVQGAFVTDKEIDSIVAFIKKQASDDQSYNSDVLEQIEANAALCGAKKGAGASVAAGGGSAGESDPLLPQAMEVAFESGKISTSLLQRRLQVGYGRAAKIIDMMQELGYVSAPDGQRPREILITKEQYMEICLREDSAE